LLQAALAVSAPALTNTANTTLPLPDGSNRSILSGGGSDGVSGDYGVEATGAATDHSSSESSCSGDGAPTLQRGGNGERSDGNNPEIAEYDTEMTIAAHLQRLLVSPTTTGPLSSPLSSTSSPLSPDPCGLDSYSLMRPANPALPIEGLVIDRMVMIKYLLHDGWMDGQLQRKRKERERDQYKARNLYSVELHYADNVRQHLVVYFPYVWAYL